MDFQEIEVLGIRSMGNIWKGKNILYKLQLILSLALSLITHVIVHVSAIEVSRHKALWVAFSSGIPIGIVREF